MTAQTETTMTIAMESTPTGRIKEKRQALRHLDIILLLVIFIVYFDFRFTLFFCVINCVRNGHKHS